MFTGIIEELGRIEEISSARENFRITISAEKVIGGMKTGDSISVNGICLTVTGISGRKFSAEVMPETLKRTALKQSRTKDRVNLERAVSADGRFSGHFVTGHIDGTGRIAGKRKQGNSVILEISADPELLKYAVSKGSIAVDGVSLTVVDCSDKNFTVSLIPHTLENTTLGFRKQGDTVNLEMDIMSKYAEKSLRKGKDFRELLKEYGYE